MLSISVFLLFYPLDTKFTDSFQKRWRFFDSYKGRCPGVYLIVLLILILLRKRLFLNMFTNLFSGIIEEESPSDSWKTLLLIIVMNLRSNLDAWIRYLYYRTSVNRDYCSCYIWCHIACKEESRIGNILRFSHPSLYFLFLMLASMNIMTTHCF